MPYKNGQPKSSSLYNVPSELLDESDDEEEVPKYSKNTSKSKYANPQLSNRGAYDGSLKRSQLQEGEDGEISQSIQQPISSSRRMNAPQGSKVLGQSRQEAISASKRMDAPQGSKVLGQSRQEAISASKRMDAPQGSKVLGQSRQEAISASKRMDAPQGSKVLGQSRQEAISASKRMDAPQGSKVLGQSRQGGAQELSRSRSRGIEGSTRIIGQPDLSNALGRSRQNPITSSRTNQVIAEGSRILSHSRQGQVQGLSRSRSRGIEEVQEIKRSGVVQTDTNPARQMIASSRVGASKVITFSNNAQPTQIYSSRVISSKPPVQESRVNR